MEPIEDVKKRARGRPKIFEEGALKHNIDIKYSTTYYRQNKDKVILCEKCLSNVSKWTIKQHQSSKKCANKYAYLIDVKNELNKNEDNKNDDVN